MSIPTIYWIYLKLKPMPTPMNHTTTVIMRRSWWGEVRCGLTPAEQRGQRDLVDAAWSSGLQSIACLTLIMWVWGSVKWDKWKSSSGKGNTDITSDFWRGGRRERGRTERKKWECHYKPSWVVTLQPRRTKEAVWHRDCDTHINI